ncbi:MAG: hypothetical protein U0800_06275 [Isosphaeraceae bacterium]
MNARDSRRIAASLLMFLFGWPATAVPIAFQDPPRYAPDEADLARLREATERLGAELEDFRAKHPRLDPRSRDRLADVEVAHKAAAWVLKLGEFFDKGDVASTLDVLERGRERLERLENGENPVTTRGGSTHGFRSKVDGSIQPYALYVPPTFESDGEGRLRLDVILHGRGATLSEVRFFRSHDGKPYPKDETGLVLHVYGRGNNAYRWAGETDVFEAIDAVKRNFPVDERRILLRGFSMGGAGAWHLGLHHPAAWAAAEAGAGFAESVEYAKLKGLDDVQTKALRIYDAADYALNASNLPLAGYGGEDDPQRRSSELIQQQLEKLGFPMKTEGLVTRGEGIDFLRVVGAKTGHKVDPESARILREFRDRHADSGRDDTPDRIRFATYTLKYSQAAWLNVEAMVEHYAKAEVDARIEDDTAVVSKLENVAMLSIDRQVAQKARIQGRDFPLRDAVKGLLPRVYYRIEADGPRLVEYEESRRFEGNIDREKRRRLQGPIDDAFSGPFLCVRGTGTPWNSRRQAWSDARLEQFRATWSRSLRGELPIKLDTEVTAEEMQSRNLILFGDPGSNRLLARFLPDLPISWTRDEFRLAGRSYPDAQASPVMIAPSPAQRLRYVAINAIHTFGDKDFAGTNALLYPRLGDYAVIEIEGGQVLANGFCDERWRPR